jgi:hypothetical protein
MTALAIAAPRTRLSLRTLAWLPAIVLLAWGGLSAAGVPLVPNSHAVSTGSATVNATVALDVHIAGTCAGNTNFPSVGLALGDNVLASCGVTFGTNNGATSALKIETARPSGAAFCQSAVGVACAGGNFTDVAANSAAIAGGEFGVKTTAITSCTTPTWTNLKFNPVRDATTAPGAGDLVCSMTGTTDGNYSLEFHANRAAGTPAGTYQAQANFTAEAT